MSDGFQHSINVQLRWRDMDMLGHLNQSVYHELLEEGRAAIMTEIIRRVGVVQAHGTFVLGCLLILVTGFLEGPAYSGTIALRQRLTPPAIRGQVLTTLSSVGMVAASAGAAIGGLVHDVTAPIVGFTVINLLAAAIAVR